MSNSEFLKKMLEKGEEHSAKPIGNTVARVKFDFGYSSYTKGHSTSALFRSVSDMSKAETVSNEVTAHSKELGGNSKAVFGLKYTVPSETVLSFEAEWAVERFVDRYSDEEDFFEIYNAIDELGLQIGKWAWCAYQRIESPTALAKGEDGKYENRNGDMVYPRIIVPIELFADEMAARDAVTSKADSDGNVAYGELSDKAKSLFSDIGSFLAQADQIKEWYNKALKGEEVPSKPIKPYLKADGTIDGEIAKMYIGDVWGIESSDVEILLGEEVPF